MTKPFQLTAQQKEAKKLIQAFMHKDNPTRIFKLAGYAGVGKTTLLKDIYEEATVPIRVCAYTGKATNNLNLKLGQPVATTLHKLIYSLEGETYDPKTKQVKPNFSPLPILLKGQVVALDEYSLVNQKNGQDLMNTYAKILAIGDPFQLPPVEGEPFIHDYDYLITQITRQAKDSGIIRQLTKLRSLESERLEEDDGITIVGRCLNKQLLDADIVLCFDNSERNRINRLIRRLKGYKENIAKEGETVIALLNNEAYGLYNGSSYKLLADFDTRKVGAEMVLEMEDGRVNVIPNAIFVPDGCKVSDFERGVRSKYDSFFDFGYCQTVHKSQGSEWNKPFLIDNYYEKGRRPKDWRNWLYTGVSRTKVALTYFNKGTM